MNNFDKIIAEYLKSFDDDDYIDNMTTEDLKIEKERIRELKKVK